MATNYASVAKSRIKKKAEELLNKANFGFWHSPVGKAAVKAQQFIESPRSIKPIPQVQPFKGTTFKSKAGNFAANLPGEIGNAYIAPAANLISDQIQATGRRLGGREPIQYKNLKSNINRLSYTLQGRGAKNKQQVIGDVAGVGSDVLTYMLPKGVKDVAKLGYRELIKQGAKTAAKYGGAYGLTSGLAEGRNETLPEQLKRGVVGGATGYVTGGVLGGAISTGGYVTGKVRRAISSKIAQRKPTLSPQEVQKATDSFIRNELGQFTGTKRIKDKFYKDPYLKDVEVQALRRDLGLPQDYRAGFVRIKGEPKKKPVTSLTQRDLEDLQYGLDPSRVKDKSITELAKTNYIKHGRLPEGVTREQMESIIKPKPIPQQAGGLPKLTSEEVSFLKYPHNQGYQTQIDDVGTSFEGQLENKLSDIRSKLGNKVEDYIRSFDKAVKAPKPQPFVEPKIKISKDGRVLVKMKEVKTNLQAPQTQTGRQLPSQQSVGGTQQPPSSGGSSNKAITENLNPQDPYFNVERLNVPREVKKSVAKVVEESKPDIERVVGKKLSNKEVLNVANNSAATIRKVVTREETMAWEAKLLRARQQLAEQAQSGTVTPEYLDNLIAIKSQGTDIARKLQSLSINADPTEITAKQAILEAVLKATNNADDVLRKAQGVDFNDMKQATAFYRQFIKPTKEDWMTLLRYNSMLSSPNTHIVNISSNFQGTGLIAPVEKTILGGVDFLKSAATGRPREFFAGEGASYAKGYYGKMGEAAHNFADVMRGKTMIQNPDVREIPLTTKGAGRVVEKVLSYPLRLLEGADVFFQTLARGGAERSLRYRAGKGVNVANIQAKAQLEAAKRVFRGELTPREQGTVLNAIDEVTKSIFSLRNNNNRIVRNIAKFTLPFVKTPMNILKQGVEYSPMGFTTMYKAGSKTEQFTKALMGTGIGLGTAILLGSDRLSWAEPTNAKKRDAYRAAGLQPYSIKIGDNWISYSKLHPAIAFNFAMAAAVFDAQKNQKLSDSEADTVLKGLAKFWGFFADQSYLKNIGDFVASSKGDLEGSARYISNYPQQLIPFRALMGWVTRLTDPNQRKVDPDGGILEKQLQQIATQIPGLSQTVPERVDTLGNPVRQQNPYINALSPNRVTTENPESLDIYNQMEAKTKQTQLNNQIKEQLRSSEETATKEAGFAYIKQPDGDIRTIDLSIPLPEIPDFTGDTVADKKLRQASYVKIGQRAKDIRQLMENNLIDPYEAEQKLNELEDLKNKIKGFSPTSSKSTKKKAVGGRKSSRRGRGKAKLAKIKIPKFGKVKMAKLKVKTPKLKKLSASIKQPKEKKVKLAKVSTRKFKLKAIENYMRDYYRG